jgi:drug/metabolite transporter (DMT)-like permease
LNPGYPLLILSVVVSVSFGHVMKWGQRRKCDLVAIGAVNYVVATVVSSAIALTQSSEALTPGSWIAAIIGGTSYVVSYFFYSRCIRLAGVSISTTVVRLSVLPAVLASVLLWNERPGTVQTAGILLVLVAMPLLSRQSTTSPAGDESGPVWIWLIPLFLTTAGGSVAMRLFQEVGTPGSRPLLLAVWFGVASVIALAVLRRQGLGATRDDWRLGALLGTINVVGNTALLISLHYLPGSIVFPASSGGGVMLAVLSAWLLWGERLSRPALAGVAIAVPALVLMNLPV